MPVARSVRPGVPTVFVDSMNMPAMVALFAICLASSLVGMIGGRVLVRCGMSAWSTPLLALGAPFALLLFGSHQLATRGTAASAVITAKQESVSIGEWGVEPPIEHRYILVLARHRRYVVGHRLLPGDLQVDVDATIFDQVREGEVVAMHQIEFGPMVFSRLDQLPWWDLDPGLVERLWSRDPHSSAVHSATARVLSLRVIRQADAYSLFAFGDNGTRSVTLRQPYDEVEFGFTTRSGARVLAVDRVDAGSAGVLRVGSTVMVRYFEDDPHDARLAAGTREHRRRNLIAHWLPELIAAGLILGAGLIGIAFWRRRRNRTRDAPMSASASSRGSGH